nr:N-methyl-D-aspartate receptor NMDAR2C subunit [uncultured Pseudomonas sp.]
MNDLPPALMKMLSTSWSRCWHALDAESDGAALMRQLLAAYQEPQRKYHTLQHLTECLAMLQEHLELAEQPGEVEMALWFHDAVYDVKASDNEQKSADWASRSLAEAGVAQAHIDGVVQLIMATCHSALPQGRDQQLLVDVDLSILGSPRARFVEYERQIAEEYSWVPEIFFRQKRGAVLEEFIARRPIYSTAALQQKLERQAQDNLAFSLERLAG